MKWVPARAIVIVKGQRSVSQGLIDFFFLIQTCVSSNVHIGFNVEYINMVDDVFFLVTSGFLRILTQTVRLFIVYIYMPNWWGMSFALRCLTDGGRGGLWQTTSSGTGSPVPNVGDIQYLLSMKLLIYGIIFAFQGCLFYKRIRLVVFDLLYIWFLLTKLRIIRKSLCGVLCM